MAIEQRLPFAEKHLVEKRTHEPGNKIEIVQNGCRPGEIHPGHGREPACTSAQIRTGGVNPGVPVPLLPHQTGTAEKIK